jgi:hypothetical protein
MMQLLSQDEWFPVFESFDRVRRRIVQASGLLFRLASRTKEPDDCSSRFLLVLLISRGGSSRYIAQLVPENWRPFLAGVVPARLPRPVPPSLVSYPSLYFLVLGG